MLYYNFDANVLRNKRSTVSGINMYVLLFQVNVLGLCICTRESVKLMKERGVDDGHIFLISRLAC